jgi:hypothetical protein
MDDFKENLKGKAEWFRERSDGRPDSLMALDAVKATRTVAFWKASAPGSSRWQSIGPVPEENFSGIGRITSLAVHPQDGQKLLAGAAAGGAWFTVNGGTNWAPLMDGQSSLTVGAVAIAPSNPNIAYVASGEDAGNSLLSWPGPGVYKIEFQGQHWGEQPQIELLNEVELISSDRFSALKIDPTNPDIFYVAGNRGLHKKIGNGWITGPGLTPNTLLEGGITDVVIDPHRPKRVYVGVASVGIFRAENGGEPDPNGKTFTLLKNGVQGKPKLRIGDEAGWIKLAIGIGGAHRSNFLVAKMGSEGEAIYCSINGGDNWEQLAPDVCCAKQYPYCGIIAVDPTDENIIYTGTTNNLKRSINGGKNVSDWDNIFTKYIVGAQYPECDALHPDQQALVFDPNNSKNIYVANDGGVYFSGDRGEPESWLFRSNDLIITQCYDMDASEKDENVIACAAQDVGIFYRDPSQRWHNIKWGDGTQITIDPTDPTIFYYSYQNGVPSGLRRAQYLGAVAKYPFKIEPLGIRGLGGESPWVTILKLDPSRNVRSPLSERKLFVCGVRRLFYSNNSGHTWSPVVEAEAPLGGGLVEFDPCEPDDREKYDQITALEFAPSDPTRLYLATRLGSVWRADNGGLTAGDWHRVDTRGKALDYLGAHLPLGTRVMAIAVHPTDPNNIWVVFGGLKVGPTERPDYLQRQSRFGRVFRSGDGGETWLSASGSPSGQGLPDIPTSAIGLPPQAHIAFVGTDAGVYRTDNDGGTWELWDGAGRDLPAAPVTELCLKRTHGGLRLYAATMGRGIYARDV